MKPLNVQRVYYNSVEQKIFIFCKAVHHGCAYFYLTITREEWESQGGE